MFEEPKGLEIVDPLTAAIIIESDIVKRKIELQKGRSDYQTGQLILSAAYGLDMNGDGVRDLAYIDQSIKNRVFYPLGIKVKGNCRDPIGETIEHLGHFFNSMKL